MRLIDKGYYDYDYEYVEKKKEMTAHAKSDEEMQQRLARFGFATRMVKEETPEELQQLAMSENNE